MSDEYRLRHCAGSDLRQLALFLHARWTGENNSEPSQSELDDMMMDAELMMGAEGSSVRIWMVTKGSETVGYVRYDPKADKTRWDAYVPPEAIRTVLDKAKTLIQ